MFKQTKNELNDKFRTAEKYDFHDVYENCRMFSNYSDEIVVLTSKLIEIIQPKPSDTVLEVGCGPGCLIEKLAKRVKKVVGIDPDTRMLELAKKRLDNTKNVELINDKFENYQSPEKFDVVLTSHTFTFFNNKLENLKKIIDCAKTNAKIILVLHTKSSQQRKILLDMHGRLGSTLNHLTAEDVLEYLEAEGYAPSLQTVTTSATIPSFEDVLKMSYFLFRIKYSQLTPHITKCANSIFEQYNDKNQFRIETEHGIISFTKV